MYSYTKYIDRYRRARQRPAVYMFTITTQQINILQSSSEKKYGYCVLLYCDIVGKLLQALYTLSPHLPYIAIHSSLITYIFPHLIHFLLDISGMCFLIQVLKFLTVSQYIKVINTMCVKHFSDFTWIRNIWQHRISINTQGISSGLLYCMLSSSLTKWSLQLCCRAV